MKRTPAIAAMGLMSVLLGPGSDASLHGVRALGAFSLAELSSSLLPQAPDLEPVPAAAAESFPFLEGEESGSVSIGDTSHGRLAGGVRLRESEALGVLPGHRGRGLSYGTEQLVGALERAGRVLHEATKTRLWIGNLSSPQGGDIDYSVSHNSGRDADIAFCYLDARGKPVDPDDLIPLTPDGRSELGPRFDAARTWIVVRSLLTDPTIDVQYLFIAYGLETMLLDHARKRGEPIALLTRAAGLMWQPSGAAAHNDHLHLRIYCGRRDVAGGCRDTGTVHEGIALHTDARAQALARARAQLGHRQPTARRRALERLALLEDVEHAEPIAALLDDPAVEVRRAAAWALARTGGSAQIPRLAALFAREEDNVVRIAVVQAIGALGGEEAGRFLAEALGEPQRPAGALLAALDKAATVRGPALVPLALEASATLSRDVLGPLWEEPSLDGYVVQLAALEASARSERLEPVPALLALLDDRDGIIRSAAAQSLRMITNVGDRVAWEDDGATLAEARARWHTIWRRSRAAPRVAWLLMGMSMAGYRVPRLDPAHSWELVRAIAGADHLSYNAQRLLGRIFPRGARTTAWSKAEACRYWLSFIDGRRDAYGLEEPPERTRAACWSL